MTTRLYSSISQETTLTAALNSSATSMTVVSSTGLLTSITPGNTTPLETFTVVIDPDTALEEIVDVTYPSAPGNSVVTIVRARDGSLGIAHSAGAKVRHMGIGRDFRETNQHIENVTTAHGLIIANVISSATGLVTSAMITDGTILDADIAGAAAIAKTKVAGTAVTQADTGTITSSMILDGAIIDADINAAAAIAKTKISGTAVTVADTGTVTSAMLLDGTIVNTDVNASAAIAYSKLNLTGSVVSADIVDGTIVNADINASAAIAYGKLSLAGTITSSDLTNDTILDADINTNAAIAWTKIAPSATVSAVELGYVDGVTSAIQTQIDAKLATATAASTYAPIASPTLTGVPAAPTASSATNTTQIATTAFVSTAVSNLVNGASAALDTLNELASALGNDANFATTTAASIATKLPLAGGTMSGAIAMGTSKITGLGTPTLSTDAATKAYADSIVASSPSNLTGPITSVGAATAIASQTGTGTKFVVDTSPTLVTPVLGVATATSINATPIPSSKTLVATDSTAFVVPSQVSQSGKYLTTNGTTSSWGVIDALPSQTSNSGKFLTTNGTAASWAVITTDPTPTAFMLGGM